MKMTFFNIGMWSVSGEHLVICGKAGGSKSMHYLVEMNFCYQQLVRNWHYHN